MGDFSLKDISPNIGAKSDGAITSSTDLVGTTHFVFVRIVRARNFPTHYGIDYPGPYVEVKIGRFKGTTTCFRSKSDPEWDRVFACEKGLIQVQETTLDIALIGYEGYGSRTSFPISDILTHFPTDSAIAPQWHVLEGRFGGELMLSCWMGTQADEAFPEAWHLDSAVTVYNVESTRAQIHVMPRVWCLRVNLIQADKLAVIEDATENGKTHVFVKATLRDFNVTIASKPVESNDGNRKWNEDLLFTVPEPFDQQLAFSVEQVTSVGLKVLGTCVIPVKNADKRIDGSPPSTKIVYLKQDDIFAGTLSVKLSLDGGYHMFDEDPTYSSDLNPTAKKLHRPSVGVFQMGILNATGLPGMKAGDRTDAYCVAKYGAKWVRTRTVLNSLFPKWNEQYCWDVYDPCTFITVCVFDNDQLLEGAVAAAAGAIDARIGKVRIRLSEMEINRVYSCSYPLVQLQPTGLKRMGEIQLAFRFCCQDKVNLYKMYTFPMLPRMHFTNPLSPAQMHGLRKQTLAVVLSKMWKNEPPLRPEVIEFMLDRREMTWSMRRGRANFERINVFVSMLSSAYARFDDICTWKNPILTLIICLVFLIMIFHPQHLLPTLFSLLILNVLQQHRKKPGKVFHVDLQLSHAHTASIDELEEEFDPIPSRFGDNIIRSRYDMLRITGGKYVALIGDLATRGERLQSLLTWQDPIATMLAMVLCLISGIVTLIFPFQTILCIWFLYLVRHPVLRAPFPALYENWVRRMPSKVDSMI